MGSAKSCQKKDEKGSKEKKVKRPGGKAQYTISRCKSTMELYHFTKVNEINKTDSKVNFILLQSLSLDATSIDLEQSKDYLLYDFWGDRFLGKLKSKREFNIKNQSCMLLGN